jgi:tRNA(Ile)-lysidine synthase
VTFSVSNLFQTLSAISPPTQRFWIAYSGGLDSHLLLHALAQLRPQLKPKLCAIHIHHGLQAEADEWANHCQDVCQSLDIPCEVRRVKVNTGHGESIEANARTARYEAITQLLAPDEVVLTAQHADDQAETVLLQLLRGSGVAGLAAMPAVTRLGQAWLVRPLLAYTRNELHDYAQKQNLHWIEDSSNADTRFDRNFIRQKIMPVLQQRWPSVSHIFSRVAHHQAEADGLIQILAKQDLKKCQGETPEQLFLPVLSSLSAARQHNVLRFWLKKLSLTIPSTAQLQQIFTKLITAKSDRQPVVRWQGGEVRRYHQSIFAMPNLPNIPDSSYSLKWEIPKSLSLPLGELSFNQEQERGLVLPIGTQLTVRFRQGGETFRWHGHQRVVKKLLQTAQIPPWIRHYIPFIYNEDNLLISIPNLGIADGFMAREGEIGWEIKWDLKKSA